MPDRTVHVYDPEDPVEDFVPLPFEDKNVPDDGDDIEGVPA